MLLGVAGFSKTGKTNLITRIVSELASRGLRVVTVKHAHEGFELLPEGKDTTRHLSAGATFSIAVSKEEMAMFSGSGSLEGALELAERSGPPDVILVEGFKTSNIPKLVLGQAEVGGMVIARSDDLDYLFDTAMTYIDAGMDIERSLASLPGLDCGKCGFESCREFAVAIQAGTVKLADCENQPMGRTKIVVDGVALPVGPFVDDIVANTVKGMVQSLKGGEEARTVTIEVRD